MADVFGPKKRSRIMAAIRSKNTQPEVIVRKIVRFMGYRCRHHVAKLPGAPDIVIPSVRTIVQVRGCFWHGHRCLKGRIPKANRKYWKQKILGNKERDRQNDRRLRAAGWRVRTIWECAIRASTATDLNRRLGELLGDQSVSDKAKRISRTTAINLDRAIAAIRDR
jgi:DNA mismatch endonuclease (patch repair protein)